MEIRIQMCVCIHISNAHRRLIPYLLFQSSDALWGIRWFPTMHSVVEFISSLSSRLLITHLLIFNPECASCLAGFLSNCNEVIRETPKKAWEEFGCHELQPAYQWKSFHPHLAISSFQFCPENNKWACVIYWTSWVVTLGGGRNKIKPLYSHAYLKWKVSS